jgi:hypothetical protein
VADTTYKLQYRNANTGKMHTEFLGTKAVTRRWARLAKAAAPQTHELRVRRQIPGGWEDVTDQF